MRSLKDIFINRMDVVDKGDNKNAILFCLRMKEVNLMYLVPIIMI